MAIKYLSSIDLRTNELQYAVIQPLTVAPTGLTAKQGQIYFNTADQKLKIYTIPGGWVTVGGVNSVVSGDTNTIVIGGTASDPSVAAITAAVTSTSLNLTTGKAVYDFVIARGYVESVTGANSTFINTVVTGTDANPIITASLNAANTPTPATYLRGDNQWMPITGIYNWKLGDSSATTVDITNNDVVKFLGTTGEIETSLSGKNITIGLPAAVSITTSLTVVGAGQNSFGGQVTIPITPVAATDAASKAYVDASVAGGLVYQGGYDAATNVPNLDNPPTGTIKRGFAWTVTGDGLFFTEQVRVGDVLIAEIDTPTTLADWTTVQSNVDLATLTTVGLGNVNAGGGIGVSYTDGTATVINADKGSDQNIFKNIAVTGQSTVVADNNNDTLNLAAGNAIAITTNATNDTITIASTYTPPVTSYATTIATTSTITHNLNTLDVIVQLYDTVTNETVYSDIDRASVNTVTITFASTPTNPVRVLVQK
jgi:hypothetical protein